MRDVVLEMGIIRQVLVAILIINTIGAMITVFRKPRSISSILAWLAALIFFPVIGFVLYLFCGRGIDGETVYKFKQEHQKRIHEINEVIQKENEQHKDLHTPKEAHIFNKFLRNIEESPLSKGNSVELFIDGKAKFEALFADIRQAKDNVHVEYYAFFDDEIGNEFLNVLVEKAKEGVEVRLIYDPWGARGSNQKFFQPLMAAGGKVTPFITSKDLIRKTRLNYHLHRKIVVIDGQIGWTGGFNVGDQYLGRSERFGYWRDTHGRIEGTGVFSLQEIFLKDWNASVKDERDQLDYEDRYFVVPEKTPGAINLQVVSDGPEHDAQLLKGAFIKMILAAENRVWVQTPYLIPDDPMITALLIAAQSGIDVRIMIPCMPDHPFIYRATQYYANYLHKRGVKIYHYQNGFLHAKTILTDDAIASFGSTNQDIRSYSLNFEVNVFAYDEKLTRQMAEIFEEDMLDSLQLTDQMIAEQSRWLRFKQNFSRLLSPIL